MNSVKVRIAWKGNLRSTCKELELWEKIRTRAEWKAMSRTYAFKLLEYYRKLRFEFCS